MIISLYITKKSNRPNAIDQRYLDKVVPAYLIILYPADETYKTTNICKTTSW